MFGRPGQRLDASSQAVTDVSPLPDAPPAPEAPTPPDGPTPDAPAPAEALGLPPDTPAPAAPMPEPPGPAVLATGLAAVAAVVRGWPAAVEGAGLLADPVSGVDIVFGVAGNAAQAAGAGWSVPEPGAMWSTGPQSMLTLPGGPWVLLEIELAPFVDPERLRHQRIAVRVGDTPLASFELPDHAVLAVPLPPGTVPPGASFDLLFETPDASRPIDVTGVDDDRLLAFSFRRLLLKPAPDAPRPVVPFSPAEAIPALPADALMARFESLGENCEFGLVQRRCGVEQLGLLRFASAPLPKLRAALRADFDGLGRPEEVDVQVSESGEEYMVHDRRFGLNYHAWVRVEEQTHVEIHARETRRLPFLVRKLTEDLQSGEKIFVFHGMEPLTLTNARDLKADIGRYGPGILFWVELADAEHAPGSVEWVDAGLLKGYIDRFAPGENAHDLSLECWVDLCQRAAAAVDAAAMEPVARPNTP